MPRFRECKVELWDATPLSVGPQELGTRTHDVSSEVCDMSVHVRGSTGWNKTESTPRAFRDEKRGWTLEGG